MYPQKATEMICLSGKIVSSCLHTWLVVDSSQRMQSYFHLMTGDEIVDKLVISMLSLSFLIPSYSFNLKCVLVTPMGSKSLPDIVVIY